MNRGAKALEKLMPERGDQARLADELGLDQGYLSRLARGLAAPGLPARRKFRERFGIALEAWDEPVADAEEPAA